MAGLTLILLAVNALVAQDEPVEIDSSVSPPEVNLPRDELNTERIASLSSEIETATDNKRQAVLLAQRGREYVRTQQWTKAAVDYRKAANMQPQESMHWMRSAVLLQTAKKHMQFDQLANEMLEHFKDTRNPHNAERTAKMCWLPTPPVAERETIEKLADLAMKSPARPWGEYYRSTRALGHYRYKEYDAALKALDESDRLNAARAKPRADLDAINRILQAMCLAKMGRNEDAAEELLVANRLLKKHFADAETLYASWNDWLLAKMLYDEAVETVSAAAEAESSGAPVLGYTSPEAAYAAVKAAYEKQDWITFARCHDEDGQTTHAAVALMSAFVTFSLIADEDEQKEKFDAVEAICKKHELKPLLTFVGQLGMFGEINFGKLTKKHNDKIVDYLRTVKNKPEFIAEVHKLLEQDAGENRVITLPLIEAKLVRIDIDGDKAQAVMQRQPDEEPKTVDFRKINGRWIISAK